MPSAIEDLEILLKRGLKEQPLSDVQQYADVLAAGSVFPGKSTGQVKALDFHPTRASTDFTDVRFSVQHNLDRNIRNVRVLVVWKRCKEKLDYSAYLVRETIPANQAAHVDKKDKGGIARFLGDYAERRGFTYEARVLDYEILQSSGELQFK